MTVSGLCTKTTCGELGKGPEEHNIHVGKARRTGDIYSARRKLRGGFRLCVYIIKSKDRATGQVERVRQQQEDLGHVPSSNNHLFTCLEEAFSQI